MLGGGERNGQDGAGKQKKVHPAPQQEDVEPGLPMNGAGSEERA